MRERGLKYVYVPRKNGGTGRSREGAWIEIWRTSCVKQGNIVAPVRERGLKSCVAASIGLSLGRSREGAWIEILPERVPE